MEENNGVNQVPNEQESTAQPMQPPTASPAAGPPAAPAPGFSPAAPTPPGAPAPQEYQSLAQMAGQGGQAPPPPGAPPQGAYAPLAGAPPPYGAAAAAAPAPEAPKKKKTGLIIAIAAVAVLAVAALVIFVLLPMFSGGGGSGREEMYNMYRVFIGEDGDIGVLHLDGTYTDTGLSGKEGYIGADGKWLLYVDDDDVLYAYDMGQGSSTELAEDVYGVSLVMEKYALYGTSEEVDLTVDEILEQLSEITGYDPEIHQIVFEDSYPDGDVEDAIEYYELSSGEDYPRSHTYTLAELGSGEAEVIFDSDEADGEYVFTRSSSRDNDQWAYVSSAGKLVLMDKSGSKTELTSLPKDMSIRFGSVPQQGQMVVWSTHEVDDDEYKVYAYVGGDAEKIFTYEEDSNYSYVNVFYNQKDDAALLQTQYSEFVYIVSASGDVEKVKIDGDYVQEVYFSVPVWQKPANFDEFYVATSDLDRSGYSNNTATLYYMGSDRTKEKITDDVEFYYYLFDIKVAGNKVFYIDSDDNLYGCEVTGGEVGDAERIAKGVYEFDPSYDGSVVWYARGDDSYSYTVYRYENGESEKVAADSATLRGSYDGKTAYFLQDSERYSDDVYYAVGTMTLYVDGELIELGDDTTSYTLPSPLKGSIDPNRVFFVGDCYEEDEAIYGTLYFYNGKEVVKLADEVFVMYL